MKNKKSSKVLGKLNKNSNQRNIVINGLRVSQGDKMTVINCDKEFIFKTVKAQYFKNSVANFCCEFLLYFWNFWSNRSNCKRMNIPAKLDKKSMKKDGKNFSSCENFLICDINTATASTICSRYYKGLSAHKDNLVIVITEQNRTEQNRTEQNRTEHC